jgi:hypothetical protein
MSIKSDKFFEREYFFEQSFNKAFGHMIESDFVGWNDTMQCYITGKEHYKQEMKRRGLVPFDESLRLAEQWEKENPRKEYGDLSPKAQEIIASVKLTADKNGNVHLGDRAINALREIGAIPERSMNMTSDISVDQGGFYDE